MLALYSTVMFVHVIHFELYIDVHEIFISLATIH